MKSPAGIYAVPSGAVNTRASSGNSDDTIPPGAYSIRMQPVPSAVRHLCRTRLSRVERDVSMSL